MLKVIKSHSLQLILVFHTPFWKMSSNLPYLFIDINMAANITKAVLPWVDCYVTGKIITFYCFKDTPVLFDSDCWWCLKNSDWRIKVLKLLNIQKYCNIRDRKVQVGKRTCSIGIFLAYVWACRVKLCALRYGQFGVDTAVRWWALIPKVNIIFY